MRAFALFLLFFIFIITFTSIGENRAELKEGILYIPDIFGGIYIKLKDIAIKIDERIKIEGGNVKVILNLGWF